MDYNTYIPLINSMSQSNNEFSARQVQNQMNFQEYMSNTAHQREVADLRLAGLNPVLSAGGSGAAAMQGAAATADNSNVSALSNILGTVLNNENARAIAEMNNSAAAKLQAQSDSAAMDRAVFSAKSNADLAEKKIQAERGLQDAKLSWQAAQNNLDRLIKEKADKNSKEYQDAQIELKKRELVLKEKEFELKSVEVSKVAGSSSGSSSGSNNVSPSASPSGTTTDFADADKSTIDRIRDYVRDLAETWVNNLSDKGYTTILGVRVPNTVIKKIYGDYKVLRDSPAPRTYAELKTQHDINVNKGSSGSTTHKTSGHVFGGSYGTIK